VLQAIHEGARTVSETKRRTRAGTVLFPRATRLRLVRQVAEETKERISQVEPSASRSAVGALELGVPASPESHDAS